MSRYLTVAAVNEPWDGRDDPAMALVNSSEVGAEATAEGTPEISSRAWSLGIGLPAGWSWEHLVLAVVVSGAIAWWGLAVTRIIRFQRLMTEIEPASGEWQRRTVELARRLGLAGAPSLCLVPGRVPPMLWAIGGKPRLLVPSELWSETSVDERTALLLHELRAFETSGPLGALARVDRRWTLLVASGGMVGPAFVARSRGAVL